MLEDDKDELEDTCLALVGAWQDFHGALTPFGVWSLLHHVCSAAACPTSHAPSLLPPTTLHVFSRQAHKKRHEAMVRYSTSVVVGATVAVAALLAPTAAQFHPECGLGEMKLYIHVHGTDKLTTCTDYFDDVDPYAVATVGSGTLVGVLVGGVCWVCGSFAPLPPPPLLSRGHSSSITRGSL